MKVRIIKGIFSLLLLLASTTTMAETVIIDFTGTVDEVEGTSPLSIGNGMSGHIEFNTGELIGSPSIISSSALFGYQGANSFGSASATSGWTLPEAPGVQSVEVLVFDNYFLDAEQGYYDTLDIEVTVATGEHFGFWIICDESEGLVDLNAAEIIDFERLSALTSTPYALEFWAHGEPLPPGQSLPSGSGASWKATGPATITSSSVVPVPAAVWLFGSGLLGLVGTARRRSAAA